MTISFFYRENVDDKYFFMGRLKYISHDKSRERPVYFQWQIIDWNINSSEECTSSNDMGHIWLNLK